MKIRLLTIMFISAIVIGCEQTDQIEAKKNELSKAKEELFLLKDRINKLEDELAELGDTESTQNLALVSTLDVKKEPFYHHISVRGEVQSNNNAQISAELGAAVKKINVVEGQSVKKGQVLIVLDDDMLVKSIKELQSSLDLAVTIYERQKKLWEQNIGTEVQYLEAKNRKESLELRLATNRTQLSKTRIKAPFDGVIDMINIRIGEMAQPGFPIVRLVSMSDMYIQADVSETYIGKFRNGQKVEVYFPSTDVKINSIISAIGQVINMNNRTFEIQVKIPDDANVKPNMIAVLTLTDYENEKAIAIPTKIIQTDRMGKYVFKVMENEGNTIVKRVDIEAGITSDNQTEVVKGLQGGEMLVNKGGIGLADGVQVTVSNE